MQMAIHTFIPLIGGRFRVSYRVVLPFTFASNMDQYFVMCSKIGRFCLLIKIIVKTRFNFAIVSFTNDVEFAISFKTL